MSTLPRYTCPGCAARVKTPVAVPPGGHIKCPRCQRVFAAATAAPTGPNPTQLVPVARETKLVQAAKETKLAATARETKLAGTVKETKLAAFAKETKLAAPPVAAKPPAPRPPAPKPPALTPTPALVNQIHCPKCTGVFHTPGPSPVGRSVRCPTCTTVFVVTSDRARRVPPPAQPLTAPAKPLAAPAAKQPAAPMKPPPTPVAKKTIIEGRPVVAYTCPGCRLTLKSATPLPPGKQIKCPRCQRLFGAPGDLPAKRAPAPRTTLAPPAPTKPPPTVPPAKPTKLTASGPAKPAAPPTRPAGPQAQPTRPAPQQAKPTTLVPAPQARPTTVAPAPQTRPTTLAPGQQPAKTPPAPRPVLRLPCPGCRAVLKLVGTPPPGTALKCPRCKRPLRILPRTKAAPALAKPASPAPRKTPPRQTAAARPAGPTRARPEPAPRAKPRSRVLDIIMLVVMFGVAFASVGFYGYMKGWWGRGIPGSSWALFAPPEGHCQLLMPGVPEETPAPAHGPGFVAGRGFQVIRPDENASFALFVIDRDAKVTGGMTFDQLYAPERDAILRWKEGEVVDETEVVLGSHAGKELHIRLTEGGILLARVFLVRGRPHDRLYVLVAVGAWLEPGKGDAARFFRSFTIEPGQPANRPRDDRRRVRNA